MNYSLLSFILIIVPLAIIIVIVIRKFPQIALLDVDNMPEVKAGKKKDEVLKKRVEENAQKAKKDWLKKLGPVLDFLKKIQNNFRSYVTNIYNKVEQESKKVDKEKPEKEISEKKQQSLFTLLHEGDTAKDNGDFETAEKKYITAIKIDPKNADAYRGLAEVYSKQEQLDEAKETYKFVLHLKPHDDEILVKLAEIFEEEGDTKEAIEYYQKAVLAKDSYPHRFVKLAELLGSIGEYETALEAISQAVELEPNNPKYLDILAEMSIMSGDKETAEEAYQKLRMTNPDNQKLVSFKERIGKL